MEPYRTILLAEDDDNDVILIQRAFADAGVREPLHAVQGGAEAIAYLSGQGSYTDRSTHPFPALLLLDLKMGKASGFEVLRWLQGHPELRSRLAVVVLSANERNDGIKLAYELGANSYLEKPFGYERLVALAKHIKAYWLELNRMAEP